MRTLNPWMKHSINVFLIVGALDCAPAWSCGSQQALRREVVAGDKFVAGADYVASVWGTVHSTGLPWLDWLAWTQRSVLYYSITRIIDALCV